MGQIDQLGHLVDGDFLKGGIILMRMVSLLGEGEGVMSGGGERLLRFIGDVVDGERSVGVGFGLGRGAGVRFEVSGGRMLGLGWGNGRDEFNHW